MSIPMLGHIILLRCYCCEKEQQHTGISQCVVVEAGMDTIGIVIASANPIARKRFVVFADSSLFCIFPY